MCAATKNGTSYDGCIHYTITDCATRLEKTTRMRWRLNINELKLPSQYDHGTLKRREALLVLSCGIPHSTYAFYKEHEYVRKVSISYKYFASGPRVVLTCITKALCTFTQKASFSSCFIFVGSTVFSRPRTDLKIFFYCQIVSMTIYNIQD